MSKLPQKNIFSIVSESISEGLIVVNSKQEIIIVNSMLTSMFGYDKKELVGAELNKLIPTKFHGKHGGHFNHYYETSTKRKMAGGRQLWGIKKDGTQIPVKIGLNPFKYSDETYIVALVIDVTESLEAEKKIIQLNEQLEVKIKQRTAELQQSVTQLEKEISKRKEIEKQITKALEKEKELNDLKSEFLTLVSHEFKTPLSNILISSTLISKYKLAEQQANRERHIQGIQKKIHYLTGILNDFLSIEKLEKGNVKYDKTLFDSIYYSQKIIDEFEISLKQGQAIIFDHQESVLNINTDIKTFDLILTNLITNAIKYSPNDTTITVSLHLEENNLNLTVKDNGYGIPEADQKHVFSRYFRGKNGSLAEGTGIGLNIIKKHLENLGGNIQFSSKVNQGTTFNVNIPL
ncbi:PAS domain-containing sensor histidine kinase [Joostella sp. CR20]|uniref:PAS domain-containing sensor histidine kinase n=1 Tax=Joostella sp. CR20 TaxID=2804312 RepID=UPI00313A7B56